MLRLPFLTKYDVLRVHPRVSRDGSPSFRAESRPTACRHRLSFAHSSAGWTVNSPAVSTGVSLRARFQSLRVACWSHGVRTPEAAAELSGRGQSMAEIHDLAGRYFLDLPNEGDNEATWLKAAGAVSKVRTVGWDAPQGSGQPPPCGQDLSYAPDTADFIYFPYSP